MTEQNHSGVLAQGTAKSASTLAERAGRFREGAKQIHDSQSDHGGDVWFAELFHFLGEVKTALASQPPAAPVETDADLPTYQDVRGILPTEHRDASKWPSKADIEASHSRLSAETVIGPDGKSQPTTLRQILARAALSVIEKPDGVETLDWQIADAVIAVLPAQGQWVPASAASIHIPAPAVTTEPQTLSETASSLLKRLAWYYDVNDCRERHPEDALEVPIADLLLCKTIIEGVSRGDAQGLPAGPQAESRPAAPSSSVTRPHGGGK